MAETAKPPLRKRMLIMLGAVGLVLGALVGFNVFKNHMISTAMAHAPVPPATVTAMAAEYQAWQPLLTAIGSLRAVRGVDVSTEVAGLVRSLAFESGDEVAAGQVLARLNADADLAQLRALEAAAELARTVYARDQAQLKAEAVSQAQVDTDAADLKSKKAQVAQQAALVAKKTLRAPFAGRLGISMVNPGQYLNAGDRLVTLQQVDPLYVEFTIPQRELAQIAIGQGVTLTTDAYRDRSFAGRITAINPKVDVATRNVQVEATLPNQDGVLLPGMFATVTVSAGKETRYLTLPQTAIAHNPYGDIVYLVKSLPGKDEHGQPRLTAEQVFVTPGPRRGDQVAILKGVAPGAEVVTSGQGKLKNGTPLIINNAVRPADDPHPNPQEQ